LRSLFVLKPSKDVVVKCITFSCVSSLGRHYVYQFYCWVLLFFPHTSRE